MLTKQRNVLFGIATLCLICAGAAQADVKLPAVISENMVLQQKTPVRIWGWADRGERVSVNFQNQNAATTAKDGHWQIWLKPLRPGGPYPMTITGNNTITFQNILVGEVWVCGGQSNMEYPLSTWSKSGPELDTANEEIAKSTDPGLRFFKVKHDVAATPEEDTPGANWEECNPQSSPWFSSVGYYFAKALRKDRKVPIGMIQSVWGGTRIEAWTDRATLQPMGFITEANSFANIADIQTKYKRNPQDIAGSLYNGMIAPITPFTIKGVIWYQGESNGWDPTAYRKLLPAMIGNWRTVWQEINSLSSLFSLLRLTKSGPSHVKAGGLGYVKRSG